MRTPILAAIVALSLSAPARADNVIHFKGRTIDLDLCLQGYPYTNPNVDLRTNKMSYKRRCKSETLPTKRSTVVVDNHLRGWSSCCLRPEVPRPLFVIVDFRQQFDQSSPNGSRFALSCRYGPEQSDRVTDGNATVWYVGTGSLRFDRFRLVRAIRWWS